MDRREPQKSRNTRNTLGAKAETRGLRGRQSKGEGAWEDQRHPEDRVHIKQGGLQGAALREGLGGARDFLER